MARKKHKQENVSPERRRPHFAHKWTVIILGSLCWHILMFYILIMVFFPEIPEEKIPEQEYHFEISLIPGDGTGGGSGLDKGEESAPAKDQKVGENPANVEKRRLEEKRQNQPETEKQQNQNQNQNLQSQPKTESEKSEDLVDKNADGPKNMEKKSLTQLKKTISVEGGESKEAKNNGPNASEKAKTEESERDNAKTPQSAESDDFSIDTSQLNELFTGGGSNVYSLRNAKGRLEGIRKYGGSGGSESCVEAGLAWLARHQDEDGKWDAVEYTKHCGTEKCTGIGYRKYTPALTGMSFLSFLGAGYVPGDGKYGEKLKATRAYLLGTQNKEGYFGDNEMYNHAIVLLAMVELYGQSKDWKLSGQIRKGIAATCDAQQPGGGWTYEAHPPSERNDTSVTGWQILSLTASKRMGFHVSEKTIDRAWNHLERFTFPGGTVRYADKGPQAFRQSDALAAVGLLCSLICNKTGNVQKEQVKILLENPPEWEKANSLDHGMYYWYHGTLAMFLMGGDYWQTWNRSLCSTLVANQIKAGEARGSWPPEDKWNSAGGRIYSTAINVLNLEIYYRYQPSFLRGK